MTFLRGEQIAALNENLLQRRLYLVGAIRQHLHQSEDPQQRELLAAISDSDDAQSIAALASIDIAQLSHELDELSDIDLALKSIAGGTYGVCVQCAQAIAWERLKAKPTASTCVTCQQIAERRNGGLRKQ